ncbi:hypothetical protein GQS_08895 [Thermococcus sp. 4557]|uniref:UPF0175 family protein n=1 Tax=Thermococcus sp. (strain CGMCC 1.5172 / 4557) TaxID=1042877 RepID=UPI000219EF09|nr:UPF0175 family protein [Thermococcus sp. 4557]AEK73673.1 hypothetical protein GQS_08895 [Thermococcus sp. 4557]
MTPKAFRDFLGPKPERELVLLAAIELYREGKLSLGKAAEFAGLSVREFLYELRKRDVPINYTMENAEEDVKLVEGLE